MLWDDVLAGKLQNLGKLRRREFRTSDLPDNRRQQVIFDRNLRSDAGGRYQVGKHARACFGVFRDHQNDTVYNSAVCAELTVSFFCLGTALPEDTIP
jgi:hypothetical protein